MTGRFPIEEISPVISCGRYPARAVVGEQIPIVATVFREGHACVGANVVWVGPDRRKTLTPMLPAHDDRWHGLVAPSAPGSWRFTVEAWSDPYRTWQQAITAKLDAGQNAIELANDLEMGARLMIRGTRGQLAEQRAQLRRAAATLRDTTLDLDARVAPGLAAAGLIAKHPIREMVTRSSTFTVWVDRPRALYGAWYEFFPRSEGAVVPEPGSDTISPPTHGTFATASRRLPAIADMGFDVVYLPPIHPIGKINRKGRNNTLDAGVDDVGSPWAIGSDDGGHDAVHPQLGTVEDFGAFVARARELGLEVALDLALQVAPDHPWVNTHPEWFTELPDGTIAYAENPPKKYQDIYPINFDRDSKGIYREVLRVVLHWIEHGVKIFRVDNPHTKPSNFWHWLIWEVKKKHPDVLFLAEAFTRPTMMHHLAKIGFSQSYTYFTWKTSKKELEEYCKELVNAGHYMRPNFFVNTPDILHESLQYGGPAMFKIRAVLASLLSPTWGVYSGYELCEHVAVRPGSEEYLDSEKYQLRPRDWTTAEREGRSIAPYLTRLNEVRRRHPALHRLRNLRFHHVDNDALICFSKRIEHIDGNNIETAPENSSQRLNAFSDTVLVVCSLDPHNVQWGNTDLDMPELGHDWRDKFAVIDEITGARYDWGKNNTVRLDPYVEPAHIFTLQTE